MDGNQVATRTSEAPGPVVVDVFVAEMNDHVEGVAQHREPGSSPLVRLGMQGQPESSHPIAGGIQ